MGGSSLSFALVIWTETLPDWIDAHVQSFAFFGGAPRLLVPVTPKSLPARRGGSIAPMARRRRTTTPPCCRPDPQVARQGEGGSRRARRRALAAGPLAQLAVRNLAEVKVAIGEMLTAVNDYRIMRPVGQTRRQMLEEIDAPTLKLLPAQPYVLAEWRGCKVSMDYHIVFDCHFYSVPYRHSPASVEVRATLRTFGVFLKAESIAVHMRVSGDGEHTMLA
jgi:hypothetical protein